MGEERDVRKQKSAVLSVMLGAHGVRSPARSSWSWLTGGAVHLRRGRGGVALLGFTGLHYIVWGPDG